MWTDSQTVMNQIHYLCPFDIKLGIVFYILEIVLHKLNQKTNIWLNLNLNFILNHFIQLLSFLCLNMTDWFRWIIESK